SLTGSFRVRGAWPKLTIEGSADGKSLALLAVTDGKPETVVKAGNVRVTASVESPLDPQGRIQIAVREMESSGLKFRSVQVDGSGNQARHRVALAADGEQFDTRAEIAGGITR